MDSTARLTPDLRFSIMLFMSPVDCWVLLAKVLTSSATTANPLPCSPARAASIAAFKANKLVCSAMPLITSNTDAMFVVSSTNSSMTNPEFFTFSASNSISCIARLKSLATCLAVRSDALASSETC